MWLLLFTVTPKKIPKIQNEIKQAKIRISLSAFFIFGFSPRLQENTVEAEIKNANFLKL